LWASVDDLVGRYSMSQAIRSARIFMLNVFHEFFVGSKKGKDSFLASLVTVIGDVTVDCV
jgi:hypothetical protein